MVNSNHVMKAQMVIKSGRTQNACRALKELLVGLQNKCFKEV